MSRKSMGNAEINRTTITSGGKGQKDNYMDISSDKLTKFLTRKPEHGLEHDLWEWNWICSYRSTKQRHINQLY